MDHVEFVALAGSSALFLSVAELVRRRHLSERYSLIWLFTAVVLVALAVAPPLLRLVADIMGIVYAPTALMVVGFAFVLVILLHFSLVVTQLTKENKELAQRYALLAWRVGELETDKQPNTSNAASSDQAEVAE